MVLIVIAETAAGLTLYRRARVITDPATGARTYAMQMGRWPWSDRSLTPLNRRGFPDQYFSSLPPKGDCAHIVLSGDSFVFGDGVDRDSNFVEILDRSIAAKPEVRCTRVFNLGDRGTSIGTQAEKLLANLDVLQPDVVILGQYQNDLTDLTHSPGGAAVGDSTRWRPVWERLRIFRPRIVRLLSYHVFAWMIANDVKHDALRHWSVLADSSQSEAARDLIARYETSFDSLVTALESRGIAFGVVTLPSKFDLLAGRTPEESLFVRLASERQVPYLRTFRIFDANRKPYPFLMYDGHLNEAGNRLVGQALFSWLYEQEPAPFPELRQCARRDSVTASIDPGPDCR